jgi:sulfite exporter TauE/SafE
MDLSGVTGNLNIPTLSALFLGLLAAISACPMATNIAAVAYASRRVTDRRYVVMTAALSTSGRMIFYSVLGILIIMAGHALSRGIEQLPTRAHCFGKWEILFGAMSPLQALCFDIVLFSLALIILPFHPSRVLHSRPWFIGSRKEEPK